MKHSLLLLAVPVAQCLLLSGCIDKDYDLSDIDTTSEVKINDLTLPVNIDKMKLSDVIDLDDNSNIKIIDINGTSTYAFTQTGSFNSEKIHIDAIHIDEPVIAPSVSALTVPPATGAVSAVDIDIPATSSHYTYRSGGIDSSIQSFSAIRTAGTKLTISADLSGIPLSDVTFRNLKFKLTPGMQVSHLSAGSYDSASGVWTVPSYSSANGQKLEISLDVDRFDLTKTELDFNAAAHTIVFTGELGLDSGTLELDLSKGGAISANPSITVSYHIAGVDVTAFSGDIRYDLDGLDIAPVTLTDIPDFLSGEGTNVKIINPQLYVSLNNPVGNDKLAYQTGLRLTAVRDNSSIPAQVATPDNNAMIHVGFNHGVSGPYNFLLAPDKASAVVPSGFAANLDFVPFKSLSDILGVPAQYADASTLPDRIEIDMINPGLPLQHAVDFPVGRDITPVQGKYELLAPLNLEPGSVVVYEDTDDGWSDDDLKKLVISQMTVTATVDNDAPLAAKVYLYPVDTEGREISGVAISSNEVAANAKGQELVMTMTGEIRDLDGVRIRAVMNAGNSGTALQPDQTLTFHNVRAKVSGSYTTDF